MYLLHFVYPVIGYGHLGCFTFWLLWITLLWTWVLNIWPSAFTSFVKTIVYSEMELLYYMVILFYLGTTVLFSTVASTFYIATNSILGFKFHQLILIKFNLFFVACPLVSYPRKHCQIQCYDPFPLMFSSKMFIVHLLHSDLIYFNFYIWYKGPTSFFFACVYPAFHIICLKDCPFHIE